MTLYSSHMWVFNVLYCHKHVNLHSTKQTVASLYYTHTHNRFTALLEFVRDHPGEQVPER